MSEKKWQYEKIGDVPFVHISARPGYPSVFWQGKSGKYYRTIKEARTDKEVGTVNPEVYVYHKSFWNLNKKTLWWCFVFLVLAVFFIYLYKKGKITINNYK